MSVNKHAAAVDEFSDMQILNDVIFLKSILAVRNMRDAVNEQGRSYHCKK
jgi:hypothetical protein